MVLNTAVENVTVQRVYGIQMYYLGISVFELVSMYFGESYISHKQTRTRSADRVSLLFSKLFCGIRHVADALQTGDNVKMMDGKLWKIKI